MTITRSRRLVAAETFDGETTEQATARVALSTAIARLNDINEQAFDLASSREDSDTTWTAAVLAADATDSTMPDYPKAFWQWDQEQQQIKIRQTARNRDYVAARRAHDAVAPAPYSPHAVDGGWTGDNS